MGRFFRGTGGTIFEMDPPDPRNVHAAERFTAAVEKGELIEVDADLVERVDEVYGHDKDGKPLMSYKFVEVGARSKAQETAAGPAPTATPAAKTAAPNKPSAAKKTPAKKTPAKKAAARPTTA